MRPLCVYVGHSQQTIRTDRGINACGCCVTTARSYSHTQIRFHQGTSGPASVRFGSVRFRSTDTITVTITITIIVTMTISSKMLDRAKPVIYEYSIYFVLVSSAHTTQHACAPYSLLTIKITVTVTSTTTVMSM